MVDISKYFQHLRFEIKSLLFDWGDTVMKAFPDQFGPMAFWQEVAAIEGIDDILALLIGKYQLVLVSNAGESDRDLVRQALERVNLAHYFHEIFTPRELNEFKPAPNYFRNALKHIGVEPENAIMIGDDYEHDIIGAKQAGLWTIWYNAKQQNLNPENFPYHDAEIYNMKELPTIIHNKMPVKFF